MKLSLTGDRIITDNTFRPVAVLIPVPLANEMLSSIGFYIQPQNHTELMRFHDEIFGEDSPIVFKRMIEHTLQLRHEE